MPLQSCHASVKIVGQFTFPDGGKSVRRIVNPCCGCQQQKLAPKVKSLHSNGSFQKFGVPFWAPSVRDPSIGSSLGAPHFCKTPKLKCVNPLYSPSRSPQTFLFINRANLGKAMLSKLDPDGPRQVGLSRRIAAEGGFPTF